MLTRPRRFCQQDATFYDIISVCAEVKPQCDELITILISRLLEHQKVYTAILKIDRRGGRGNWLYAPPVCVLLVTELTPEEEENM